MANSVMTWLFGPSSGQEACAVIVTATVFISATMAETLPRSKRKMRTGRHNNNLHRRGRCVQLTQSSIGMPESGLRRV